MKYFISGLIKDVRNKRAGMVIDIDYPRELNHAEKALTFPVRMVSAILKHSFRSAIGVPLVVIATPIALLDWLTDNPTFFNLYVDMAANTVESLVMLTGEPLVILLQTPNDIAKAINHSHKQNPIDFIKNKYHQKKLLKIEAKGERSKGMFQFFIDQQSPELAKFSLTTTIKAIPFSNLENSDNPKVSPLVELEPYQTSIFSSVCRFFSVNDVVRLSQVNKETYKEANKFKKTLTKQYKQTK